MTIAAAIGGILITAVIALAIIVVLLDIQRKEIAGQKVIVDGALVKEKQAMSELSQYTTELKASHEKSQRMVFNLELRRAWDLRKSEPDRARKILLDEAACPLRMRDTTWQMALFKQV